MDKHTDNMGFSYFKNQFVFYRVKATNWELSFNRS